MAISYTKPTNDIKVGTVLADGRTVTTVNKDASGNVIGYGTGGGNQSGNTPAAPAANSNGGAAGAYLSAALGAGLTPVLGPVLGTVIGGAANGAGNAAEIASSYAAAGNAAAAYTAAQVEKKIQENSAAWHTATPEQRIALERENEALRAQLGTAGSKATAPAASVPQSAAPAQTAQKTQSPASSIRVNPVLDMNTDYTVLINKAIEAGDWEAAAQAEFLRNQKIGRLQSQGNTDYEKTYRYTTPNDTELPTSKPQGANPYADDWMLNATDYASVADPSLPGYSNPGNWTGGAVGSGIFTYNPNLERQRANDVLYAGSGGAEGYFTPQGAAEAAYLSGAYKGINLEPWMQLFGDQPVYVSDQAQMDAINEQASKMGLSVPAYTSALSSANADAAKTASPTSAAEAYAQGALAANAGESPFDALQAEADTRNNEILQKVLEAIGLSVKSGADRLGYQIEDVNTAANDSARQAYIASMQSRRMLPEILAAQGQPLGGATETANLKLLTSYENDLNTINTARNKDISEINRQIAALYDEGALKAAETEAEFGRSALDTYLGLGQAEIAYMQAAEEARKQERLVLEQQERQDYLATITRYSADYQAEINRLKAQGYDDSHWKIQYLQAARQGKLDDLARAQAEALALEEERAYELQKIAYSKSFSGSGSGGSSLPTVSQAIDNISSGYGSEIDYYVYNQSAGSNYSPSNPPTWAKNVTNPYGLTPQESAYASGDRSAATVSGIKHLTATEMENLDWQVGLILQNNGETSYFGETMYAPQSVDDAYRLLASYVDSGRITELEADAVLRRYFPNMPIVKGR